ncbi:HK97 family phage prohead protease [bacterium]|nr:HK97 family phage prohead protease [bacterium]
MPMKVKPQLAKIMQNAIRKDCSFEIREVNIEERSVVHYASTKTPDCYGTVFLPDSFDLTRFAKNPVVLYAHDYFNPPVGRSMWQKPDKFGLLCKTEFAKTTMGDDLLMLYSSRFMQAWSVGAFVKNSVGQEADEFDELVKKWGLEGNFDYIFKEVELLEYSPVPVPGNPDALTQALRDGRVKSEILVRSLGEAISGNSGLPPVIRTSADPEDPGESQDPPADPPAPGATAAAGQDPPEVRAEIENLRRDLAASRREISELRAAVADLTREVKNFNNVNRQGGDVPPQPVQDPPAPEPGMRMIAVGELAEMIRQAVDGAIKQARGRLNN